MQAEVARLVERIDGKVGGLADRQGADAVEAEHLRAAGRPPVHDLFDGDGIGADLAVYALDEPRYFGLHDPALGPVVSGGRPTLRWLVADGAIVVEDDAIPGLDMAELQAEARAAVARLIRSA